MIKIVYHNSVIHLSILLLLSITNPCYGADTNTLFPDTVLGDVGGMRSAMSDAGVDIGVTYTGDLWSVRSGGIKTGNNYLDNLDITFDLDGEKLFNIEGSKAFVYFINNNGSRPNDSRIGSAEGIDNIEVGTGTFKLYELWVEQAFLNDSLSVLFGLHDLNSEFAVTDMSANFMKPTMQIGQSFAQSGRNGPSIFPSTSLAGRVKVIPYEETYLSFAAYDGVPGDPDRPHGTRVNLNRDDGLLLIAELGYEPMLNASADDGAPNKLALGGWMYTQKMDDLVRVDANGNPVKENMAGLYFLSSYQFYKDETNGRDLGFFFRAGVANDDTAQVDWDYVAGMVGTGWIPGRSTGEIGLGVTQAHNGDAFVQSVGGAADSSEYGMEMYYRDTIIPGVNVQPDFQYIINPGSDMTIKNATVVGIRVEVNL